MSYFIEIFQFSRDLKYFNSLRSEYMKALLPSLSPIYRCSVSRTVCTPIIFKNHCGFSRNRV